MSELINILILVASFLFGIICIQDPIKISHFLAVGAKYISEGKTINPSVAQAINLLETNPSEFERKFGYQLNTIRRVGYIALSISIIGACLAFQ